MTCTVLESGVHSFDPLTNILFFQNSFRFTAKLRGSHRDFLYTSCPHIFIAFPIINVIHMKLIFFFFTKNESTLMHHNHPKSSIKHLLAYLGVLSRCHTFSRFGEKYNDAYPSLYHMSIFHCPNNPLYSTYSSLPATPLQPFYCCNNFAFSRMSHGWNHSI